MRLSASIIVSVLLHGIVSLAANEQCGLSCEHGICSFVSNNQEELSALVQSGKMIEECVCDVGYGGAACDVPVEACQSDGKCKNGRLCQRQRDTGEMMCDCSVAEEVSRFAALMCRNPYTEYCADKYDPNESTSFCTNGGKCKSSFISAQVAPGNTTINNEYRHLGCVCPKEFYGPHCELLKYNREQPPDTNADEDTQSETETDLDIDEGDSDVTENDKSILSEPVEDGQITNPTGSTKPPNVPLIVGLSFLTAFTVLLLLVGMKRRTTRPEIYTDGVHIHDTDLSHGYPPEYASDTLSYGEAYLYSHDPNQIPAMSGRGPYYTDNPYDTASQRSGAGLYRENDGSEHSSKYRSARRTNPPLYVDFETNTTISDRRYRGYQEEDHTPNDWESGTSQTTGRWGSNSHAY
ncbi:hypothetical protein FisN_2Lh495 [Fistulifera solaris]|uniref:EGF-like domain-containing protein n=1 Tax=Fistulifera solaris TaxID=1519565 RepID=A0A1Z5JAF9_FISSO|nr:hypothetical protein FisN_2Lh495 [Fistulifera solaris]|eukprot:GAX10965.1 hypothetical protein FisN_2Lh495 [Fistulifera solaris]